MDGKTIFGALLTLIAVQPLAAQHNTGTADSLFRTAEVCIACHNGLTAESGQDISIGFDWRSSMMANSSRDPYWQAGVRREVMDHQVADAAIQDKCATCHMSMARYMAHAGGASGAVFANLPIGDSEHPGSSLAADGVSCTVCHQVRAEGLEDPSSYSGEFKVDERTPLGERPVFGPFEVDDGRTRVMHSSSGFKPEEARHIESSALCGSCHTLYTHALNERGEDMGELAEQMPYIEWLHSSYRETQSCQSCHMPEAEGEANVSNVLGQPRANVSRHVFRGGNFFMPRMLNRYRDELGAEALAVEFEATARRSAEHLASRSATLTVEPLVVGSSMISFDVVVQNLAGHKLPTAYPSRRAWLHVTVTDRNGVVIFESGAVRENGSIVGNDNDADGSRFEPHYRTIDDPDEVQIYEAIMEHYNGGPTTGLLNGVRYLKDNRVLPHGFDKSTADWDIAVAGDAAEDENFVGGHDRVRYEVEKSTAGWPLTISAELLYQPISYRWAENLADYDAHEPQRFVRYFRSMSNASYQLLAETTAEVN